MQEYIGAIKAGAWAAVTGAAFAYTFYAKARNKEGEEFQWNKFLPTVAAGATIGFVAGLFNQDFELLWGVVGGFTGSLLVEVWKAAEPLRRWAQDKL